ncbi:MAG: hypothetical protein IJQ29_00150, partial [Synergistaceae bacterium]|nr:hypothetical protein [Synergistaceae bacterium]
VTGRTFTEQALQIVSGVFSGTATEQKECQDIIVSCASYLDDVKARIDAICPVLDNNGKLKEFKVINIMKPQVTKNLSIGLAAGDFVGDEDLRPWAYGRKVECAAQKSVSYLS